jgi:uncharacterized protein YlxW (UPF0749 family)
MTGGQMMVVLIVAIVMIAGIIKSKHASHGRRGRHEEAPQVADSRETERLRDEVKQLKERLAVIERITIEKENSLEREIEQLRNQ